MSNSLWPQGLQHAKLPCPSLSSRVCWNSCPLSQWCYLIISSSAVLFSFYLHSFPASGSFQMSQLFASGSQSTGASASASILPVNIQGWFPLGLTGLVFLQSGLLKVFSNSTVQKHQFFGTQLSAELLGKPIALTRWTFVSKVMSLLFNMLSRFGIAFLPSVF